MGFIINNQEQLFRKPHFDYDFVDEDGITFIEEQSSKNTLTEVHYYEPLSYKGISKTPRTRMENQLDSAHVAMANLNPSSAKDVLSFVKTWGLLGLDKVKYFEQVSFEERKGLQFIDLFRSKRGRKREPLFLIQKAIKHYHDLIGYLDIWHKYIKNLDTITTAEKNKIHTKIAANLDCIILYNQTRITSNDDYSGFEMGTFANSLYGLIYTITAEGLVKGAGLQICSRSSCKAYFRPTRSDRTYCSIQCNDAVRSNDRRNKMKALDDLCNENPSTSKNIIEKMVNEITTKIKHLTTIEIKEQFYRDFRNQSNM
ncbi:hypothetical protein [Neobacillus niacini]|uniref:hypothetical protein n=1 Tax=Neobacillus niacini TaxID=86668 RepID=UPI00398316CD